MPYELRFTQLGSTPGWSLSPAGVGGSAVLVENNAGVPLSYAFTDVPIGSALPVAVFATGVTASFTPDAAGTYQVVAALNGTEVARLDFCVPEATGDIIPAVSSTGDLIGRRGTFRLVGEPTVGYARAVNRALKRALAAVSTPTSFGAVITKSVGAGNVILPPPEALGGRLVASGSPPDDTRTISFPLVSGGFVPPVSGTPVIMANTTAHIVTIVDPWGHPFAVPAGLTAYALWDTAGAAFTNPLFVGPDISTILDATVSNVRGSLLYRGPGGWSALPPGAAGDLLHSGGDGADPSWSTPDYHAREAATSHWYKCSESSGNMINALSPGLDPLVLTGSGPMYGDTNLFRHGTPNVRMYRASRFQAAAASIATAGGVSIEAIVSCDDGLERSLLHLIDTAHVYPTGSGLRLIVNPGDQQGFGCEIVSSAGVLLGQSINTPDFIPLPRNHVMAVYDPTGPVLKLFLNGEEVRSSAVGSITTLTGIALGAQYGGAADFRGLVGDVRITKSILNASYAAAATIAMGRL